jgi:NAD(P)H dehydrogenase (quinone)
MPKYVLTGADGNLGRVAATWALETAGPDQEVVLTT